MSKKKSKSTRHEQQRAAAERAAAIRKEQERKERVRRIGIGGAILAVVAALIGVLVWVQAGGEDVDTATPPAGAVESFGLGFGDPSAPVQVEIFEDFYCPVCGAFENEVGPDLTAAVEAGEAYVTFYPVAILDRASPTDYSTRSANAVAAVLDAAGPEVAKQFHDLLYANQPAEGGSEDPSDDQLVDFAVQAGATEADVRPAIEDRSFEQWVRNATDNFSDRGYSGTPTVVVDGEQLSGETLAEVIEALRSRLGA